MRVLVGCEFSGTVRNAFLKRGHAAYSCDLLPTEGGHSFNHLKIDVVEAIKRHPWDLIILHPPCTALGVCGNRTYGRGKEKHLDRLEAVIWTLELWELAKTRAKHVALENPQSVIFPILRNRTDAHIQYVQPYQFGHTEQKKTGFALHNLPELKETNNVYDEMMKLPKAERERIHHMSPSKDRGKLRSVMYQGIADAMADQWGNV